MNRFPCSALLSLPTLVVMGVAFAMVNPAALRAEDPPAKEKKKQAAAGATTYQDSPEAAGQIDAAIKRAKRDNKRVLLLFGADWCPWCHMLHHLFETDKDIRKILQYEYELVLVDIGQRGKPSRNDATIKKYGNPVQHGVPVLVVLDQNGEVETTKETNSLEAKSRHDPERVVAFLKEWQPKPESASRVLADAQKQALAESKPVFLHFSAPWCIWCHRFEDFLADEDIARVFGPAFVPVKIDQDRMVGAKDIMAKYCPKDVGIPFFVILDAQGKKLADSVALEGNVGCPVEPHEIAHFLKVVSEAAPKLTQKDLAALKAGLVKLRPNRSAEGKPAD